MARTRSASAHQKVLETALDLVAEHGVDATSMDAIARTSGVSKATIYKHWADKPALLLEMLAALHGIHARPAFDSGDTKTDVLAVLCYRPSGDEARRQRINAHFAAYSASHQDFGLTWRKMVMEPPRRELESLLQRGVARGELSPALDFELSLALLIGPIMYWYIFLRRPAEAENPYYLAERVVHAFWTAFGIQAANRSDGRPRSSKQKK